MNESEQYIQSEREVDLGFFKNMVPILQMRSTLKTEALGRGAIVLNYDPIEGEEKTHHFGFIEKDGIHTYRESEAIIPLVEQYNPENEVVIILVKDEEANAYL